MGHYRLMFMSLAIITLILGLAASITGIRLSVEVAYVNPSIHQPMTSFPRCQFVERQFPADFRNIG